MTYSASSERGHTVRSEVGNDMITSMFKRVSWAVVLQIVWNLAGKLRQYCSHVDHSVDQMAAMEGVRSG